jgi:hypothetical protein
MKPGMRPETATDPQTAMRETATQRNTSQRGRPNPSPEPSAVRGLAASVIFVAMLIASLSLWTAIPLGWIYIGSQVSDTQFPSEGPYIVVAVGIIVTVTLDAMFIGWLNRLYTRVTGTNRLTPMRPTWLRSMRDSQTPVGTTTVVEAVLIGSVILALVAITVWFFLLAGSPLPNR